MKIFRSSANNIPCIGGGISAAMRLMAILKRTGIKTDPWGTPVKREYCLDWVTPMRSKKVRSNRKFWMKVVIFP